LEDGTRLDTGTLVQYEDTPYTIDARRKQERINAYNVTADIRVLALPATGVYENSEGVLIDPSARRLYRIYSNSDFCQGGRHYRAFWLNMPAQERIERIVIDGKPVVEIDFSNLHPMMLYNSVGLKFPEGDAYDLPGIDRKFRPTIKRCWNAMVNSAKELGSYPEGIPRDERPPKISGPTIYRMLAAKHKPLADAGKFWSGSGLYLQRRDSDLMTEIQLWLQKESVTNLPVHDSLIVAYDNEEQAKRAMATLFFAYFEFEPVLDVERSTRAVDLLGLRR
jgi:hypothetical protein